MKNKTIGILNIGIIGLLIISSYNISAVDLSIENKIDYKSSILAKGKRFIIAKITGTIDEPLISTDRFLLAGNAKDITIKSLRGTFKIGNDYEGSDFFGINYFYGDYTPTTIDCIALFPYVEGL